MVDKAALLAPQLLIPTAVLCLGLTAPLVLSLAQAHPRARQKAQAVQGGW